ncbi:hypothetical protein HZS_6137, partial [Henneguya salminicola]
MKFKFCGDIDCPEWILLSIEKLSKLTPQNLSTLCSEISKAYLEQSRADIMLQTHYDWTKIKNILSLDKFISNDEDIVVCLSGLWFIFFHSIRNNIPVKVLNVELLQVGIPVEQITALCEIYTEYYEQLVEKSKEDYLIANKLVNANMVKISNNTEDIYRLDLLLQHKTISLSLRGEQRFSL